MDPSGQRGEIRKDSLYGYHDKSLGKHMKEKGEDSKHVPDEY